MTVCLLSVISKPALFSPMQSVLGLSFQRGYIMTLKMIFTSFKVIMVFIVYIHADRPFLPFPASVKSLSLHSNHGIARKVDNVLGALLIPGVIMASTCI